MYAVRRRMEYFVNTTRFFDDSAWNPIDTYSVRKPGGSGRDSTSPVSLLKMVAPGKLTRGEAERLISTASKLIVATETILLPQHSRSKSEPRNSTRFPHLDKKDLSSARVQNLAEKNNVRRCVVFDKNGRRITVKKNIERIDNSFDSTYDGHPSNVTSPTQVSDSQSTHVPEWLRHEMSKVSFGSEETNKLIINEENPEETRLRKRPMTAHVWSINARLRRRARLLGDSYSTAATIASEEDNGPRILKEDVGIQTETCLFPIVMNGPRTRYKIEVNTGDKLGAGTRAKIFITIRGDRGRCEQLILDNSLTHQVKFKRGQTDVFDFELPYLGQLESITIGHRKKDIRYSWYLDSVHITDCNSNIVYLFPCHQWLSAEMGPKQTLRDLSVAEIKELPSDSDSDGPGDSSETECLYAADEESARQSIELPDDGLPRLSTTPSLIANCSITPDEDDRSSQRSGTEHYPESMIHDEKTEIKKNLNSPPSNSPSASQIPPLISNYFQLSHTNSTNLLINSETKEIDFEQKNIFSSSSLGEHLEDNEDKMFRVHSVEKINNNEEKEPNEIVEYKINQSSILFDKPIEEYIKNETEIDNNIHISNKAVKAGTGISDEETSVTSLIVEHEETVEKNRQMGNDDENPNHDQEKTKAVVDEKVLERTPAPSDDIAIKEMSNKEVINEEIPGELEGTEEILEDELLTEIQFEEAIDEETDTEALDNVEIVSEETVFNCKTTEEIPTEISRKDTEGSMVKEMTAEEISIKRRISDESIYDGSITTDEIMADITAADKITVEEAFNEIKDEKIIVQEILDEELVADEKNIAESETREEKIVERESKEEKTVEENLVGEAVDEENTIGETTYEETTFDKGTEVEIELGKIQPEGIPLDAVIDSIVNQEYTKTRSIERLPTEHIPNQIKLVDIPVEGGRTKDSIKEYFEIPIAGIVSTEEKAFKDVLAEDEINESLIDGVAITEEISANKVDDETPVKKDVIDEMSLDRVNAIKFPAETTAEEILSNTKSDKVSTIESMSDKELFAEIVADNENLGESSVEMPVEIIVTKEMGVEEAAIKHSNINGKSGEEMLVEGTVTEKIADKVMDDEMEAEDADNMEITDDESAALLTKSNKDVVYDQKTNELVTEESPVNIAYDIQSDRVKLNGEADNQEIQIQETQASKDIIKESPDEVNTEEHPIEGVIFEELSVVDESNEIVQKVFAENIETSPKIGLLLNESEKPNLLELTGSKVVLLEQADDKQISIEEKVIEEPSQEKVQDGENQAVVKEYLDNGYQNEDLSIENNKIVTEIIDDEPQEVEDVLDEKYQIAEKILLEENQCETEVLTEEFKERTKEGVMNTKQEATMEALNEDCFIAENNLKLQDTEEELPRDNQIVRNVKEDEKSTIEDINMNEIRTNKNSIVDRESVEEETLVKPETVTQIISEKLSSAGEPISIKNLIVGQENITERDVSLEKESEYYEKTILNDENIPGNASNAEEASVIAEEDHKEIVKEGMLDETENRVPNKRIENEANNTSLDNSIPINESNAIEADETYKEYKEIIDEKDHLETDEQNKVPILIENLESGKIVKHSETINGLYMNGKDVSLIKITKENISDENSTKITETSVENSADYNCDDNTSINKEQITIAQEQNKPIEQILQNGNSNQNSLQHTYQILSVNPLHNNDHYRSSGSEGLTNSQADIRKLLEGRRRMLEDLECDDDYWENMANKDGETHLSREITGQRSDTVSLSHSGMGESDEELLHDQEKLNQRRQQLQYSLERMLNFSFEDGDEDYGIRKDSASGSESFRTRKGPHSLTDLSEDSEDIRPQTVLVNGQLVDELDVYPSKDQDANQFLKNAPDAASWHGSLDSEDHDVIFKPTSAKDKGIMVKAEVHRRNSDLSREKENSPLDDDHPLLKNGSTIHEAADNGDLNRVQALVAHYPLFKDIPDEKGWTPLHHAVAQDQFNVLQVLIEMGASLNSRSNSNETPLHIAVMSGHAELAKQLIVNGADVEILDSSNRLPLDVAFELKDPDMIKIFKDTRLNPKMPSTNDTAETSSQNGMFATSQALVLDANLPTEGNSQISCG